MADPHSMAASCLLRALPALAQSLRTLRTVRTGQRLPRMASLPDEVVPPSERFRKSVDGAEPPEGPPLGGLSTCSDISFAWLGLLLGRSCMDSTIRSYA